MFVDEFNEYVSSVFPFMLYASLNHMRFLFLLSFSYCMVIMWVLPKIFWSCFLIFYGFVNNDFMRRILRKLKVNWFGDALDCLWVVEICVYVKEFVLGFIYGWYVHFLRLNVMPRKSTSLRIFMSIRNPRFLKIFVIVLTVFCLLQLFKEL